MPFYYIERDRFDPENGDKYHTLDENCNIMTHTGGHHPSSSLLSNTIINGTHK